MWSGRRLGNDDVSVLSFFWQELEGWEEEGGRGLTKSIRRSCVHKKRIGFLDFRLR